MKELLSHKVAKKLAQRISSGQYRVGQILPSEHLLAASENVGRNTIRAALAELQHLGLITRRPHEGTRVISTQGAANFHQKISTLNDIEQFGEEYQRVIFDVREITVDNALAAEINYTVNTRLLRFSNIRKGLHANDPAIVFTYVYIDPCFSELVGLATQHPDTLMIKLIESRYGLRCTEVQQRIQAILLPQPIAQRLGTPENEPALLITRHYLDIKGRLLELSMSYHPGHRYAFRMTVRNNEG